MEPTDSFYLVSEVTSDFHYCCHILLIRHESMFKGRATQEGEHRRWGSSGSRVPQGVLTDGPDQETTEEQKPGLGC